MLWDPRHLFEDTQMLGAPVTTEVTFPGHVYLEWAALPHCRPLLEAPGLWEP